MIHVAFNDIDSGPMSRIYRGYAHNNNDILACVTERLKELTEGLRGLPGLSGPARHGRPGRAGKRGIPGIYLSLGM